jgi:two-component system chemotaxis sensor kinase CheA
MSNDHDPMAEIRASFFIECEELLEALQDGLEVIQAEQDDPETINVVFRAVHSIKGGAGAFGLEGLVRFAHRYETVLDEVRASRLVVSADLLKVFFQAADHLFDLVRVSRDDAPLPDDETKELLSALDSFLDENAVDAHSEEDIDFQPMSLALDLSLSDETGKNREMGQLPPLPPVDLNMAPDQKSYLITFTPTPELFETGNEPALLLRNLSALGEVSVGVSLEQIPLFSELNPEIPYLSWSVTLRTDSLQSDIDAIFEFVEGLCKLDIVESSIEPIEVKGNRLGLNLEEKVEPGGANSDPQSRVESPKDNPTTKVTSSPSSKPTNNSPATKSVVRVDLDRIERLVNLVGELVINQSMLSQSLEKSGLSPHSDAMNGLEEFQRLTRDIQDSVMMIRAQPVKSLFQRMSRIVREASSALGKEVRLNTIGESTEVDKTVIERLADPLTHMIRNAVDHGLENVNERISAGKPAKGVVNLSAAHRSGRVVIEVSDDGGGIDRPKVTQIAIDKGLISADANLNETETDNLLFLPGFSTASVVSDLSGRGVGMDVVRTAIQALGGRITISSQPGEGTTFSISLPLTLAVLDGMVIEVAGQTLVLPLNLVVETLTLADNDVEMVRPNSYVIQIRSGFVPMFDLGAALGFRNELECFDNAVVLIIAHEDGSQTALLIDNILDQRQVVIKGLDEGFHRAPGIAAATILGDGKIALIIDPSDIITNSTPHITPTLASSKIGASA